jgi:hypothetical protein
MAHLWFYNRYPKIDNLEGVKNLKHTNTFKIESVLFMSGLTVFKKEYIYIYIYMYIYIYIYIYIYCLKSLTWAVEFRGEKKTRQTGKRRHIEMQGKLKSAGEREVEFLEAVSSMFV